MPDESARLDRSSGGETVPTHQLRSALEFAVLVAREGPKLKPPLSVPNDLRRYVKMDRLTATSLNGVRRVLEADGEFRSRLAAGALDDLVDEVGRLWLQRPDGWETDIVAASERAERDATDADLARQLKRADKRREAAERAAARSAAEVIERDVRLGDLTDELDRLKTLVDTSGSERAALADALEAAKRDARHARDRELAAAERERLAVLRADGLAAERAAGVVAGDRDGDHGGDRDGAEPDPLDDRVPIEPDVLERLSDAAASLARELAALTGESSTAATTGEAESDDGGTGGPQTTGRRRRPIRMPPGVLSTSVEGARFLMRSGAPILVDGYNVSKLAWGRLDLEAQRDRLVSALEMLSRRYGSDIVVVFDGADVVGAHRGRHTGVRVVFSAADESADDWIRAEARRLTTHRHVVVVTNDREIIDGVVAVGANHLSSDQLVELLD